MSVAVLPTVSVLIPAYNHEPYLARTIESVLSQRIDFPIEILIGEDCSKDATAEVAARFQREHPDSVRLIQEPVNVGMHRNYRRLIRAARGGLIAFCEGDDYWRDASKLQQQVEFMQLHPECGAVHTEFSHLIWLMGGWRELPRFQEALRTDVPSGEIFERLLAGNFIQTCTLCVRTSLARQYLDAGFDVASYGVFDWPLSLYIAATSRIGYIDNATATYRRAPGSAMNSGYRSTLRIVDSYKKVVEDFCQHFAVADPVRKSALSALYRQMLKQALLARSPEHANEAIGWLRENDPGQLSPGRRLAGWLASSPAMSAIAVPLIEARRAAREFAMYTRSEG